MFQLQEVERELNVDPVTLREFEDMIRKDFIGPGHYPMYYIHPAIDEEVNAATHYQPLCSPAKYEPVAAVPAAVSFATQTGTPLPHTPLWRA